MQVTARLRLPPDQLWELIWRDGVQRRWLGADACVTLATGSRLQLADAAGPWRTGTVRGVVTGHRLRAVLGPTSTWSNAGTTELTLVVTAAEDGQSGIDIVESGFADGRHEGEARSFWRGALGRLKRVVAEASQRRESPRQAVIVIHGIGEQQPGRTLQAFAASGVVEAGDAAVRWVRPDRFSESFELRRITFKASERRARPTTDLFELYWAHLIRDTTLAQVVAWARGLLLRRHVPRPLVPAWLLVWALVALLALAILNQALGIWDLPSWLTAGGLVALLVALAWRLVGAPLLRDRVGDAARYLRADPGNIAHRQAIRQAGVDLVERLHDSGRYDRIVIVGHSLGGVVAYDIIAAAWIRMHRRHGAPVSPSFTATRAVERAADGATDATTAQALQHAAWKEARRNTQPWLVTDLVTLGTPLTYASFLMADDDPHLQALKLDRVLPACPPVTQVEARSGHRRFSFEAAYRSRPDDLPRTFTFLHHGAPFATTRWTNLYFPVRWLGLGGDAVGGPLAATFGGWVRDVAVSPPRAWLAHTLYWRRRSGGANAHLDELGAALGLNTGQELLELAAQIPAYRYVEQAPPPA